LKYKYYRNIPEEIKERLLAASKVTAQLDEEMAGIRQSIDEIIVDKVRPEEYELDNIGLLLDNINKRW
jgi:ppGpp synthetase/RelA/SpoT-type nucleotidyltranferase